MESIIQTEDPNTEQWQMILQYSYSTNIQKYIRGSLNVDPSEEVIQYISGSFKQSKAYFDAYNESPIDINPLLLYYGTINLLAGVYALKLSAIPQISSHGMYLKPPINLDNGIANSEIFPNDPNTGALQIFTNIFSNGCNLTQSGSWNLLEIFGSIPELLPDYRNCYPNALPYSVPIDSVTVDDRLIDRINPSNLIHYDDPIDALKSVPGFKEAYLEPQYREGQAFIILNRKYQGIDIGRFSLIGQRYLSMPHHKHGRSPNPSQLILFLMSLFALGHITRYSPQLWNPFIVGDVTGERLLIERFLSIAFRSIPNLLLNIIYSQRIIFVYRVLGG